MAATVLNGEGNVSYTNNTGQNVRIVINYLSNYGNAIGTITISNANGSGFDLNLKRDSVIGRNLAFTQYSTSTYSMVGNNATSTDGDYGNADSINGIPTEIAMEPGGTFSITISNNAIKYNILVIPEAG